VHATDAAFGIDEAADALGGVVAANRRCLLPEERLFVAYMEAHSLAARRWLARSPAAAPARERWNGALRALVAWRATHRARAAAYLVPGAAPGAPKRSTTGGTAGYGGVGGGGVDAGGGADAGGGDPAAAAAAAIVKGFNDLMDGRIAQTRRAAVAEGPAATPSPPGGAAAGGGGGGGGMSSLFPQGP
jgi:DNA polymerase III subunit gamma/tau